MSSPVIANCVLAIICLSAAAGSVVPAVTSPVGGVGKSATGIVGIFDSKRSAATVTVLPSLSVISRTSASGRARTIS